MSRADRFLKACRREPVDTTPIWLMRQAGRYMKVYRDLRAKYGILEIIKEPDLATEVTMQPVDAYELDAAIIFSDILPPLEGMGLKLEFVKGDGPVLHNPIREPADIESLITPPAAESMSFTLQSIRQVRHELAGRVPLIGFSAAPFTLASYAVEGGSSRDYLRVKNLMYHHPADWRRLMEKLTLVISDYLREQAAAGAQALQLFDSWIGALSPYDYRERVLPYIRRIVENVKAAAPGVPLIYFGTGNTSYLPLAMETGADVIGVDWRIDIAEARDIIGHETPLQGNLDPLVLLAPKDELIRQTTRVLDAMNGAPGHIFNLGHGIHKTTPEENVEILVNHVHNYARRD